MYIFLKPVSHTRLGRKYREGDSDNLSDWKKTEIKSAEKAELIKESEQPVNVAPTTHEESMVDFDSMEDSEEVQDV